MTAMTSPSWTTSPSPTRSSVTVPASSAMTGISIFIDSRMTSVSPSATVSPWATTTFQTLATISARTSLATCTPLTEIDAGIQPQRPGRPGSLATGVVGRALLQEGGDALSGVLGRRQQGELGLHRLEAGRERRLLDRRPRRLAQPDRDRRCGGELRDVGVDVGGVGLGGEHAAHKAHVVRRSRVDPLGAEHE